MIARLQRLRAPRSNGVNFQRPTATWRPLVALLWLIGALLLGTTWLHRERLEQQQQQTDALDQQFIQLTRRQEQLIQAAIRLSPQQKLQLAAFAQQTASPFPLLDAIGYAWANEVALTRLEVSTQAQVLNLDLEARVLADAFRFVERLKDREGVQVSLQQSSRKANDPARPVLVKLRLGAG